jgi:3-phenylpropionate/cinnamic acid dioxygenase small subunit
MALAPEDRAEIRNLLALYCHTLDSDDVEGHVDCYAEDGAYSIPHLSYERRGREELLRHAADNTSTSLGAPTRHWNSNVVVVEGDGGEGSATTRVYWIVYGLGRTGAQILATGTYRDRLTKEGGRWKIAERVSTIDEWARGLGDTRARMRDLGLVG